VLGLRWLVALHDERDELIEPVLTSELGRLSPATARTLLRLLRAHGTAREALAEHRLLRGRG
jgi:pyrroloquinoline quinone (PQQ) biosynthesis protein C